MRFLSLKRQISYRAETTEGSFLRYESKPFQWYQVIGNREAPVFEDTELEEEYQIYKDYHERIIAEKK